MSTDLYFIYIQDILYENKTKNVKHFRIFVMDFDRIYNLSIYHVNTCIDLMNTSPVLI